jgi:hypothetical protein
MTAAEIRERLSGIIDRAEEYVAMGVAPSTWLRSMFIQAFSLGATAGDKAVGVAEVLGEEVAHG